MKVNGAGLNSFGKSLKTLDDNAEEPYSEDRNVHLRTVNKTRATIGAHSRRAKSLPEVRQSDRMDERYEYGYIGVLSVSSHFEVQRARQTPGPLLVYGAFPARHGDRSLAVRHLIVDQDKVGFESHRSPQIIRTLRTEYVTLERWPSLVRHRPATAARLDLGCAGSNPARSAAGDS